MALTKINSEYEKNVLKHLGWKYQGLKWCEFGNQRSFLGKSGKELLEDRGVEHTSMDLNGLDGALRIDLGKPVPADFLNRYNVITNYGTIEHINNQYDAFKNAHDMCRAGGIMIHSFPLVGNWPKHCRYYYDLEFVHKLAVACELGLDNQVPYRHHHRTHTHSRGHMHLHNMYDSDVYHL